MESRIWSNSSEKYADIFMVKDQEVYHLHLTGNMLTLGGKFKKALESLEQGTHPSEIKAQKVRSLDLQKLRKAEIASGNTVLTLHGEEGTKSMDFIPSGNIAHEIFEVLMERSGRIFEPRQEEISVVEAVVPPGAGRRLDGDADHQAPRANRLASLDRDDLRPDRVRRLPISR